MTSKEALKEICINCRNNINQIPSKGDRPYKECPYRGISNDYCEEYETIKKGLEILEIIKKHKLLNYVLKNEKCANMYHLSKEEIDLLREIEK